MSYLADFFGFEDRTTLDGILTRPVAHEYIDSEGSVVVHLVPLFRAEDSFAVAGATAELMPSSLAALEGAMPEGHRWVATFQLAPDDRDAERFTRIADAELDRAMRLVGLDGEGTSTYVPFSADHLRWVYEMAGAGRVADWGVPDLLLGLLVELTGVALPDVVASCLEAQETYGRWDARRGQLRTLLDEWSSGGA